MYDKTGSYNGHKYGQYEIACAVCGDIFKAVDPKSKYCSGRCSNDAYIQQRKERHEQERKKVCPVCLTPFQAKRKDAIYCGSACKQKAHRKALQIKVAQISAQLKTVTK